MHVAHILLVFIHFLFVGVNSQQCNHSRVSTMFGSIDSFSIPATTSPFTSGSTVCHTWSFQPPTNQSGALVIKIERLIFANESHAETEKSSLQLPIAYSFNRTHAQTTQVVLNKTNRNSFANDCFLYVFPGKPKCSGNVVSNYCSSPELQIIEFPPTIQRKTQVFFGDSPIGEPVLSFRLLYTHILCNQATTTKKATTTTKSSTATKISSTTTREIPKTTEISTTITSLTTAATSASNTTNVKQTTRNSTFCETLSSNSNFNYTANAFILSFNIIILIALGVLTFLAVKILRKLTQMAPPPASCTLHYNDNGQEKARSDLPGSSNSINESMMISNILYEPCDKVENQGGNKVRNFVNPNKGHKGDF